MTVFILCVLCGLILLVWSADKFVAGASAIAIHYHVSPLLIGMLIIGFGTSAPELVVSVLASWDGNTGIAIGNAYGSNITNIALILGVTSVISPIVVQSQILKKELPLLFLVSLVSAWFLSDFYLSRLNAFLLLVIFVVLMGWTLIQGLKKREDPLAMAVDVEFTTKTVDVKKSYLQLFGGLFILIGSSRLLVFGAVGIAKAFGLSDVIVGLTVVAIGTSLPELASSLMAAKKGNTDLALGNVLGSNLFNTLAVVGLAGFIAPLKIAQEVFYRDIGFMLILTLSLFAIGYGFKKPGRISRAEGVLLLLSYIGYTIYLIKSIKG
jgi:cation:H+ antiporter